MTDVGGVVDELLASGAVSRCEMRMPLGDHDKVRKSGGRGFRVSRAGGGAGGLSSIESAEFVCYVLVFTR